MKNEVACYAGSTYPERPLSFRWEGTAYRVQETIDQRRQPDGVGFLVACSPDGAVFDLFYRQVEDDWQIQPIGSVQIGEKPHLIQN